MSAAASTPGVPLLRFGAFDLDGATGELRRSGALVKLKPQAFKVLLLLARHPGQLVTREQIQQELWGEATFVDFEQGVNHCVKEIRAALDDDAESPRYVETLPRRGYRFITPVETVETRPPATADSAAPAAPAPRARRSTYWAAAGLVVVLLAGGLLMWPRLRARALAPAGRVMLVVLPFENLSGDPTQEYLSDGLTEEMITQLGRLHPERLGVIARTSSMKYKNVARDVSQIGRELRVDYLLEGSVRRQGPRVRVSAQLIQARDGTHLWAENYDREARDILEVQSEVAGAIAAQIQLKLTPQQQARLAGAGAVDPEALDSYLKGRYYWNRRTQESLRKAREHLERSIELDPTFARAWAGLAECYGVLSVYAVLPVKEAMPRAKAAALKALEIDPTLGEPHATLGGIASGYEWDFARAEVEFKRAVELSPGHATAHQWYAEFLMRSGRFDEAEREMNRAWELDPLSLIITRSLGMPHFFRRDYARAIEHFRRAVALDPNFAAGHLMLGLAYDLSGDSQAALASLEKAAALDDGSLVFLAELAGSRRRAGQVAEARRILAGVVAESRRRYVLPYNIALVHASLGDKDQAFAWLEKSFDERGAQMIELKVDPRWDKLRSDPRFAELVRRVGLP